MLKSHLIEFFGWATLFFIISLLKRKGKLRIPHSRTEKKQFLIQGIIVMIIFTLFIAIFSFIYGKIISFIQMKYLNRFSSAEYIFGIPLSGFLLPGMFMSISLIAIVILNFRYRDNEKIDNYTYLRKKFCEFKNNCIQDTIQLGIPKIILRIFFYLIIILSIFYTVVLFNSSVIVSKDGILYNALFRSRFYEWNDIKSIEPFATSYKVFFDDGTEWNLHRLYAMIPLATKAKEAIEFIEEQKSINKNKDKGKNSGDIRLN